MLSQLCIKMGSSISLIFKFLWMAVCMTFIGRLRESPMKRKLYYYAYTTCFQILGGSLSAVITYHHTENKPKNGICVANHTTPIDVLILACDNAYDLVSIRFYGRLLDYYPDIDVLLLSLFAKIGQIHGGFIGTFQEVLSKCSSHIWFERSESKDRLKVQSK